MRNCKQVSFMAFQSNKGHLFQTVDKNGALGIDDKGKLLTGRTEKAFCGFW